MADPSTLVGKSSLSDIAEVISATSSLLWPLIAIAVFWLLRDRMAELIRLAIKRIETATDIEFGAIKIKGAVVSQQGDVIKGDSKIILLANATQADFIKRGELYKGIHLLQLVHTIRPSEPREYINKLVVFDISVYVVSHFGEGRLNDVKRVSYYLGDRWGKSKYGSLFIVENGNDGFAMTAQMYGACLCLAKIEFHDGSFYETYRYLDVEMAPIYGVPLREARR